MRVLYVLKRYPRLSETFIVNEIAELERSGAHIGVDALLPPEDGPRHPDVARVRAAVRYLPRRPRLRQRAVAGQHLALAARHPLRWIAEARRARRQDSWRRFLQAGLVARRVRAEGWQSIHGHFATAAAEVAGHAARLAGVPFTITAHAKDIYTDDNAPRLAARLAGAGAVVTVSEHNRDHLRGALPAATVRLVRNAVSTPALSEAAATGDILTVARLVEKKGIDLLIRAFALVAATHTEPTLTVVGDGPLREELTALARELGVADRVAFLGALPSTAVHQAYLRSAMVVLPCRISADGDRDGLPTVLVEALARGRPVISTDVVGIGELVRDGQTGLLVTPESPEALATAMTRLLDDPTLGRRLGEEGRRLVSRDYDPERAALALAAVFAEVRAA